MLSKRLQAKTAPGSPPHPNRSPSCLERALVGLRVTILSQLLSPSGPGVCSSQPPSSGSGKHVPRYTGSWWSPGRHSPKGVASPYILQRSVASPLSYSRPRSFSHFSFSPPSFKCLTWNFLCDFISSPSYDVLVSDIFASSLESFTFFWRPSLVRAKFPREAWTSGAGIHPLPLVQVLYPGCVRSP